MNNNIIQRIEKLPELINNSMYHSLETETRAKRAVEQLRILLNFLSPLIKDLKKELEDLEAIVSVPVQVEPPYVIENGQEQYVIDLGQEDLEQGKSSILEALELKPQYGRLLLQLESMCGSKWERRTTRCKDDKDRNCVVIPARTATRSRIFSYNREYLDHMIKEGTKIASTTIRNDVVTYVLYPDEIAKERENDTRRNRPRASRMYIPTA